MSPSQGEVRARFHTCLSGLSWLLSQLTDRVLNVPSVRFFLFLNVDHWAFPNSPIRSTICPFIELEQEPAEVIF